MRFSLKPFYIFFISLGSYAYSQQTVISFRTEKQGEFKVKWDDQERILSVSNVVDQDIYFNIEDTLDDSRPVFTYEGYFRGGGVQNEGLELHHLYFKNGEDVYHLSSEYAAESDHTELEMFKNGDTLKVSEQSIVGNLSILKDLDLPAPIKKPTTFEIISDVRAKFSEITGKVHDEKLEKEELYYDCPDYPEEGSVSYYSENGEVKMVEIENIEGDHGGSTVQYYLWDNQLFFVYYRRSYWSFDNNESSENPQTVDTFIEQRFYFHKGEAVKCLDKTYKVYSARDINANSENTPNVEKDCHGAENLISEVNQLLKFQSMDLDEGACLWELE